jgi:cysteamine dioxygenase
MDDHQSKVQRLYDACDAVFSSGSKAGLPTLKQIRWLQDLLGTLYSYLSLHLGSYVCKLINVLVHFADFADGMEAADVGIEGGGSGGERSSSSEDDDERSPPGRRFLSARAFTRITYVHIHECDDFSVRMHARAIAQTMHFFLVFFCTFAKG